MRFQLEFWSAVLPDFFFEKSIREQKRNCFFVGQVPVAEQLGHPLFFLQGFMNDEQGNKKVIKQREQVRLAHDNAPACDQPARIHGMPAYAVST